MRIKSKSLLNVKKKLQNVKKRLIIIIRNYCFQKSNDLEKPSDKAIYKVNMRMFKRINFEAMNLLQKANLNKSLLLKLI